MKLPYLSFACAAALGLALAAPVWSQTASTAPPPTTATTPTDKLTTSFSSFAGSPENANALVTGLRTGSPVTLTSNTPTAESVTFTPPTRPMGYGNVRIALSLAEARLASQGITDPTPAELRGALMGTSGPAGTTPGVLQLRASGMGWGQIAHSMGFKLGPVMSGKQTFTAATAAAGATASSSAGPGRSSVTTAAGGGSVGAGSRGKSGITTAGGGSANAGGGGQGRSHVVTAAGGASGNAHVTTGLGQGNGGGASAAGAVTAAGARGNAGGAANGHGKP